MKIIHIVHGKANPQEHNGISRVVYHLNKHEKLKGCDSQIWSIVDGVTSHFTHERDNFVTIECFPRVYFPFGRHEIIERFIQEKKSIDLVHFHLIWFYDKNIIAKALRDIGIPFIITTHGTYSKPHAYTGKRLVAKWLYELDYLNMADEIHVITREEKTELQLYGYRGKSFVAYNGVELEEIPVEFNSHYFSDKPYSGKIKLIWVGVLRADKNLSSLIRAVAMLPLEIQEKFVCILVGPDYRGNAKKYISLIRELNCIDNFDYLGPLYGQEKYDAISSADLYIMPSFSEVFSLSVLDAMACEKPSLITNGCGYKDFIKEDFYVGCEPSSHDISLGLKELFLRERDWSKMGLNARRMILEKFNWPTICDVMLENYSRIIDK